MAGSFSDFLENAVLNHLLGGPDYVRPSTVHVALFTAPPTDAGGGTEVSTGVWLNYARVAVANNATNWPAASGGTKANGAVIDFGSATISGSAPTIVAFAIFDAATDGNMLGWGDLTDSKVINNGDPVSFPVGDLTVTLD